MVCVDNYCPVIPGHRTTGVLMMSPDSVSSSANETGHFHPLYVGALHFFPGDTWLAKSLGHALLFPGTLVPGGVKFEPQVVGVEIT